jgi:RHH-type proline utilization regulon transcriptional repressor/proline dehydrogenase/delta 1-pyrroline-5-carboxylate dehydrogenase
MIHNKEMEARIREIGKALYERSASDVPSVFDTSRWTGNAVEWAMADERFKINLFRFIDVLPALKTDALVVKVLKEYFSDEKEAHGFLKWGLKGLPSKGLLSSMAGKVIRQNVEAMARQFIAARDAEEAVSVVEAMRKDGLAFGIDVLGEVVVSEKEVRAYRDRYLDLLGVLAPVVSAWPEEPLLDRDDRGTVPRTNISLKISSFYSQLDPVDWAGSITRAKDSLRPVFQKAKETGSSITFDMEHYYLKDLTIAIFKSMLEEEEFRELPFAGIALQAYLKDTIKDLNELIAWTKKMNRIITVRLVKGAYWDYEIAVNRQREWPVPVFVNKEETDYRFEELTHTLLSNTSHVNPAIATHNIRSISYAISVAESLGLEKNAYEFQMLFGMAEPVRTAVKGMGHRVRIYTPAGELIPGMAYLVRRLLENTSNESFLKRSFVESVPFKELIKAPGKPVNAVNKEEEKTGFVNEPPLDFSKAENRDMMKNALISASKDFGRAYPLVIGGEEVYKKEKIRSFNPARPDETIGNVSVASTEDADVAVREARKAFRQWKTTPPEERAAYLTGAAGMFRKQRAELAALEVYEVGKSWKEADADVAEAIDYLEYYAREMVRLGRARRLGNHPGEINEYLYEPKGTGVVISPWNFPLAIATGMVSAGIVTGNCVIFKPSGLSPVTGWRLFELFRNSGLPKGVLQFLPGPGEEIGEYLVSHPGIDFITFTGSRGAGLRIVERAGTTHEGQRNVKRVVAEMGGKNAIIIDQTADVDDAVKGVLESALGYQGQKCSACSRVIIVGEAHDSFCERMKEAMDSINIGDPENPGNFMGPLIDEAALKKTRSYIKDGEGYGNKLFSRQTDGKGYFSGPVIFVNVDPDSPLAQDEIFGPLLSVIKVNDIDEAIETANNSLYALTGGIFSRSPANIEKVRTGLTAGNLYINRSITGAIVSRQPFGGFGMSGVGSKAGGPDYLLQFMNPRSISENTMRKGFTPIEKI